jgi:hypothetical protein
MPFDIAKLNEKKQEARGAAEKDQKAKSKAARAAARRRWSAPAGSARGTPRGGDADRRRSTPPMPPPPPLAAAAALEDRERRQSQHFSYDEMPVHAGYVRERDYSGSSAEAATTAAVNKMGHAYVDASVVVRGIEQLSKDKCEHCNRRCPVEAVGETRRRRHLRLQVHFLLCDTAHPVSIQGRAIGRGDVANRGSGDDGRHGKSADQPLSDEDGHTEGKQ